MNTLRSDAVRFDATAQAPTLLIWPIRRSTYKMRKLFQICQWVPHRLEPLVASPQDAVNVFDFEPVAYANVPPAHFAYMASGIGDEVTLRANQEDFQHFWLMPAWGLLAGPRSNACSILRSTRRRRRSSFAFYSPSLQLGVNVSVGQSTRGVQKPVHQRHWVPRTLSVFKELEREFEPRFPLHDFHG
jgi:hypothetical protein